MRNPIAARKCERTMRERYGSHCANPAEHTVNIGNVLAVILVLGSVALMLALAWGIASDRRLMVAVPRCEEDSPGLMGSGDFIAGRWTVYTCEPS